ncbi:MAG TPA: S8 family peptidase [Nevskiaceae bacterium]|nr:S8 family peptidase [Nevskiaceae bacterium]
MNRFKKSPLAALAGLSLLGLTTAWSAASAADAPAGGIIVKYKGETQVTSAAAGRRAQALDALGQRHGLSLKRVRRMATGADVIRFGAPVERTELKALIEDLASDPAVEYAEEDAILEPSFTPNDTRFNEQWHYFETTAGINLPAAWDITRGAGVKVGVIDTGFRPHFDLATNIVGGFDFISPDSSFTNPLFRANDGNGRDTDARDPGDARAAGDCGSGSAARDSTWHGTHVAGTVAALTDNGTGVAGVADAAKVVPLRVLGRCGGLISDIADAVLWGAGATVSGVPDNANRARVLNLSLGGTGSCSITMQTAIDAARVLGSSVVVAAGNAAADASNHTPANCAGVISVAAVKRNGGRASYSNFGSSVDIAAPGGEMSTSAVNGVLSTLNTGTDAPNADTFAFFQGTSMAAPHVSGVAALMASVNNALTPAQTESLLKSSARAFPVSCTGCGTGIVDALAAVQTAQNTTGEGGGSCPTGFTKSFHFISSDGPTYVNVNTMAKVTTLKARMGAAGETDLFLQRRNDDGSYSTIGSVTSSDRFKTLDRTVGLGAYRWMVTTPARSAGTFTIPRLDTVTLCRRIG